ncbi:MAG: Rrf2 family transcriptional regulator [Candidatus Omnitrophica bacterium]|nr:Rrf2 family transcriptional regulator [Candidatus Omnitrophota bacterium]
MLIELVDYELTMKITYKGDYALKALLYLAAHYGSNVITIHELARQIDAPLKFLEQVLLELKRGGFVESRRGNIGGYMLSRAPSQMTVGEVIRFIDGPIEPIACVKHGYSECADVYKCAFRKIWQNVAEATSNVVDKVTFETLAAETNARQEALLYSI